MGKANVHPTGEYEGVYYVDFENLLSYTKKDDETERKTLKNISPWEMSDAEIAEYVRSKYKPGLLNPFEGTSLFTKS